MQKMRSTILIRYHRRSRPSCRWGYGKSQQQVTVKHREENNGSENVRTPLSRSNKYILAGCKLSHGGRMLNKLLSAVILTILVVAQGAVAAENRSALYEAVHFLQHPLIRMFSVGPKGEYCCHPGPIEVGHPKPLRAAGAKIVLKELLPRLSVLLQDLDASWIPVMKGRTCSGDKEAQTRTGGYSDGFVGPYSGMEHRYKAENRKAAHQLEIEQEERVIEEWRECEMGRRKDRRAERMDERYGAPRWHEERGAGMSRKEWVMRNGLYDRTKVLMLGGNVNGGG
ncbi:hypothetical protein C8R44DRAFT_734800 [Mycena epipterygia]|nr:hypothetical protein C8R44DRAFT_734800 [Mycena epipterygia]